MHSVETEHRNRAEVWRVACELLEKCPFYNDKMPVDSALGRLYKANYCESNKDACARHMVASTIGRQFVDVSLYPNMGDKAKRIIEANSR